MFENNQRDISIDNRDFTMLSLFSDKLKIGIIGGGKASLIKARGLINKGCKLEILSKEFNEEFYKLSNVKLIKGDYTKYFIKNKHLIIIAINEEVAIDEIIKDCQDETKIYINCSEAQRGMAVIPAQRSTREMVVAINSKVGNPKASVLAVELVKNSLEEKDSFFNFTNNIRKKTKGLVERKKEILDFIISEDFEFYYNKGKAEEIIKLFFYEESGILLGGRDEDNIRD